MNIGKFNLVLLGVFLTGGGSAATLVLISGLSSYPPFYTRNSAIAAMS